MFSQHGHLTLAHSDRAIERDAGARRGEPAARDRLARRLPRRDRAALPAARPRRRARPGRSWARSTTRPAGSSATTPSSGASPAAPTAAASRSTRAPQVTGIEHGGRPRHAPSRRTAAGSRRTSSISAVAGWSTLVCGLAGVAAPDHDAHPPGVRDRADEAVPRRDHRLGADARLRLADRPRRVPDRRRDRAVHDLQVDRHVPVPRVLGAPRARALPAARAAQGAAHLDRPLRPLARLQPDPRPDRARGLPRLGRLGHLRLQGRADRRHDARRARRDREDARR